MRAALSPCAVRRRCRISRRPYSRPMAGAAVERLLRELARDQVAPEPYSRRSWWTRATPVVLLAVALAAAVVVVRFGGSRL